MRKQIKITKIIVILSIIVCLMPLSMVNATTYVSGNHWTQEDFNHMIINNSTSVLSVQKQSNIGFVDAWSLNISFNSFSSDTDWLHWQTKQYIYVRAGVEDDTGKVTYLPAIKFVAVDGIGSTAKRYVEYYPYENSTYYQFDGRKDSGNATFDFVYMYNRTDTTLDVFGEGYAINQGYGALSNSGVIYNGRQFYHTTAELSSSNITAVWVYIGAQSDFTGKADFTISLDVGEQLTNTLNLNDYHESRNNANKDDFWTQLTGLISFVSDLVAMAVGVISGLMPLFGFIVIFYLLDALLTSVQQTSFTPIGKAFMYIFDVLMRVWEAIMGFFQAVADFIPF